MERLIVMARYPEPGQCKTRLQPVLGEVGAAELHREMLTHTLRWVRSLQTSRGTRVVVRFVGGDDRSMSECCELPSSDWELHPQGDGDLGQKMWRAVEHERLQGATRIVVVGTDCPELSAGIVGQAFDALHQHQVVLGPARDGGYYLIGLQFDAAVPVEPQRLFHGIDWGSDQVLTQTLRRVDDAASSVALLQRLADVDRPEDLPLWRQVQGQADDPRVVLTVVIPTVDEETDLEQTLASVPVSPAVETILVAAGEVAASRAAALRYGMHFLQDIPCRAQQMNQGARMARGELLLFLHADTELPPQPVASIQASLRSKNVAAGAFSLRIASDDWRLRWIEWGANWRSRGCQLPYGDQAIFLRRTTFQVLGGFPVMPLMEDYEFMRRVRRVGNVVILSDAVTTSARRWRRLGPLRATLANQVVIAAYHLGVSPSRLAQWYRTPRPLGPKYVANGDRPTVSEPPG